MTIRHDIIVVSALLVGMLSGYVIGNHKQLPDVRRGDRWIHGANPFLRETNYVLGVWDGYVRYVDWSNGHVRYQQQFFFVRDSTLINRE